MRRSVAGTVAVAAMCLSSQASANMVSFYLDQSNVDPTLPDGTNYLQVTVWDGASAVGQVFNGYTAVSGDVVFKLQTLPALSQFAGTNYGIDEFAFNTTMNTSIYAQTNFKGLPSNWSVGIGSQNADGFGKFELSPGTSGANNVVDPLFFAISGIGGDNMNTYSQEASSGNAGQGNYYFASHVINFQVGGLTSAWFGGNAAVVPLPAPVWLLISGLGAAGALIRRRTAA